MAENGSGADALGTARPRPRRRLDSGSSSRWSTRGRIAEGLCGKAGAGGTAAGRTVCAKILAGDDTGEEKLAAKVADHQETPLTYE